MSEPHFKTPAIRGLVLASDLPGFIIASAMAPVMTAGHLLFAAVTTAYMLAGIQFLRSERDLIELFGNEYERYRQRVAMLVPFTWK